MPYLDDARNCPANLRESAKRVEVDLEEIERVISLARRTPGLAEYTDELQQLSIFFRSATRHYRRTTPHNLVSLVEWWEQYRAAVIQRYAGITDATLRAADKVVAAVFDRFLDEVPSDRIAYSRHAKPLVYGGPGGPDGYFTHPPGWNRPFAIINLPHAAFDHVWQWLALPHEVGHDVFATVEGLQTELETALEERMRAAVADREVVIPSVDVDLRAHGIPHRIRYSGADFLASVWRAWANEAQSDAVGLLACGGGALVALQYIIGYSAVDRWQVQPIGPGEFSDAPEEHPTAYIRNELNLALLRRMDPAHARLADEIDARFAALRPDATHVTWRIGESVVVAQVPVDQVVRSARIAADVIASRRLTSLGGKSYAELFRFSGDDQRLVDGIVPALIAGDPTFAQGDGVTPRHALAATIFAFERASSAADVINRTFRHFV